MAASHSSSMNQRTPPPDVAPELRNAYLRAAAQLLLRPSPSREQDRTSSGLQGKYLVIRRLMPLFEQYLPKETADQLRNEMAVLGQGVEEDVRSLDLDNPIQKGITPDRKTEDVEKSLLDRIERAKTSEERDAIYRATRSPEPRKEATCARATLLKRSKTASSANRSSPTLTCTWRAMQ